MRIVNIEDFFHPNAGYQINILSKYMVKHGYETYILTSRVEDAPEGLTSFFGRKDIEKYDREYEALSGVKIIRVPVKRFVSSRAIFTKELDSELEKIKPDIVYVHGNDTFAGMKFIWRQKKLEFALISDSHMLAMASKNPFNKAYRFFYKKVITPRIIENKLTIIRTQDDDYVKTCLGIPLNQAPWISYGADTILFHPDASVRKQFRKDNDINEDTFVILYAGKLDESKGGILLAEAVKERFNTIKKDICVCIVGNTSGEYGEKVEAIFNSSDNKVLRFPTQRYIDLAPFYQSADLAVFPRQCSLSFYDVQACGLPVVLEDNNINVDRCSHGNGVTFKAENLNDFREKMESCIDMESSEFQKMKENAVSYIQADYDYEKKADEYIKEIEDSWSRYKESNNAK